MKDKNRETIIKQNFSFLLCKKRIAEPDYFIQVDETYKITNYFGRFHPDKKTGNMEEFSISGFRPGYAETTI